MSEILQLKQAVNDASDCLKKEKKRVEKIEGYRRPAPTQLEIAKKEVALRTRQLSVAQSKLMAALGIKKT